METPTRLEEANGGEEGRRSGEPTAGLIQNSPETRAVGGDETDSQTPLLLAGARSSDSAVPDKVTAAAMSFSKPKAKPGLWNLAKAETRQQQQQQQQQQQPQQSETIVETPTPSIKVTEPSFDGNANADEKSIASSGNTKGHSIQFADLVMSTLPSQVSAVSSYSAIEICVYMMDNKGLTLVLDEGRTATSDFILDVVLEELGIPKEYKPCFGIWLSSPLLHLQLRPTHVPHKMAKHWTDFLKKFTLASDEQLISDEPILRLQRNVFLSPSAELEIDHPEVIRLLYCEASENVLEGLYPMDVGKCHKLAGLSAVHQLGSFSEADHPPAFYKKLIPSLLPEWIEKSRSMFLGCSGSSLLARLFSRLDKVRDKISYDLQRGHKFETEHLTNSRSPDESADIALVAQRQFLQHCYQLPFYGCAFFRGILYKPPSIFSAVWNLDRGGVDATFPVTIAVSLRGVCLLDLSTAAHLPGSLILSVPFSQLHWVTAELSDTEDEPGLMSSTSPAVLPSLFLHFSHPGGGSDEGDADGRMLQIVTKQAHLVDALMQTCVRLIKSGFVGPSPKTSQDVSPRQVFGPGVSESSLFSFDREKEEAFLRPKVDEKDECLTLQLERLKLRRAADYDD